MSEQEHHCDAVACKILLRHFRRRALERGRLANFDTTTLAIKS